MVTKKLISLFENVMAGQDGNMSIKNKQALKIANWFYAKYKLVFGERQDDEIEEIAEELIKNILYRDIDTVNENLKKLKENQNDTYHEGTIEEYLMINLKAHFDGIVNRTIIPVEALFGNNYNGSVWEEEAKCYSILLDIQKNPKYQAKSELEIDELHKKELKALGIHEANFRIFNLKLTDRKLNYIKNKLE
jgi:hypothetical protein